MEHVRVGLRLVCLWLFIATFTSADELQSDYDMMKALRKFQHASDMGWMGNTKHPCEWAGISCDIRGNIVQMKLNGLGLAGGSLPGEWGIFDKLRVIDLRDNDLVGPLPAEWGNMEHLEYLYLENNMLTGPIPESWCKLQNLKHLYLDHNKLSGRAPECSEWKNMEVMFLEHNEIEGPLPREWGRMMNLRILHAGNNQFSGELPSEWSKLISLEHLRLEYNELSGPLPTTWSFLARLKTMFLQGNSLTGNLPIEYGWLINLEIMSLDKNKLSGPLPASWKQMGSLKFLHLYQNKLSGSLPGSWGGMISLKELHLDNNNLSGPLPPDWGYFRSLTHLYLRNNHFSGPLPAQWASLAHLQELYLWDNELSGDLPPAWNRLSTLRILALHQNSFSGHLPPIWKNLKRLQYLYLQENKLDGGLPSEWGEMTMLKHLMLQGNKLKDSQLPVAWQKLKNLVALNLAGNDINTTIRPDFVGLVSRLQWLGLKDTPSSCVDKTVLQSMSSSEAEIFLAALRLKTAPASNPSPTDISVCVEARPPVARQPPKQMQMQPPPSPPPPVPEAPAAFPPPSPPLPSPPPPPPPSPLEIVRAVEPNDVFAPASRAAAPDAPEVAPEETTKEISDIPAAKDLSEQEQPQQEETVLVHASAADVNSMLTEALVISATVLFVFVIIFIIVGTVWVLRKNSKHNSGEEGGGGGSRMRPMVMQTSALGGLRTPPDGNSGRTVETPRTPGGRRRAALFLHGLPTPRTTDELEATACGDLELSQSGDGPSHNGNATVISASPFGFEPPQQCSSEQLAAAEFEVVPEPEQTQSLHRIVSGDSIANEGHHHSMFDFRAQNIVTRSAAAAPSLQTQKSLPAVLDLDLDLEPESEASRPKLDYSSTGSSHRAAPLRNSCDGIYIPPNLV